MHRYNYISSFSILLTALTLFLCSSCARKSISIVKRKHSSGYYVNISHPKAVSIANISKPLNSKLEIKLVEPPKYPITQNQNQSLIENRSNEKQYMASMDKHAFSQKSELNSIKKLQNKNNIILKNKAISKLDFKKLNKFQMVPLYHPKVKDDTYTILLVILSLFPFIALIAMYLKDNKSITMNFWVDLLLHLTVIGYAIFAVLVVLDIISLA